MPSEDRPPLLRDALEAFSKLLDLSGKKGMVIGGVAYAVWGQPRSTDDVDGVILAWDQDIPQLLQCARRLGLESRLPKAEEYARKSKMLLLRHQASGTKLDISLAWSPFESEAISRSHSIGWQGFSFPVIGPEDLIIFKLVASRPQDLADIDKLLGVQTKLDRKRIQKIAGEFAVALDRPEILANWENLLQRSRPKKERKTRRKKSKSSADKR